MSENWKQFRDFAKYKKILIFFFEIFDFDYWRRHHTKKNSIYDFVLFFEMNFINNLNICSKNVLQRCRNRFATNWSRKSRKRKIYIVINSIFYSQTAKRDCRMLIDMKLKRSTKKHNSASNFWMINGLWRVLCVKNIFRSDFKPRSMPPTRMTK